MQAQWSESEQKILSNFLEGNRIVQLPAKQKKRLVILRWLLEHIDPKKRYPESQLNQLIAQFHPDFATIRRELYEFRFMDREQGIYWRISEGETQTRFLQED